MAVITYLGTEYTVDHAVKGADFIHGYDANSVMIVSFEGINDFSGFSYNGTYMEPEHCLAEGCNDVKYVDGVLKKADGTLLSPVEFGAFPRFRRTLTNADDMDDIVDDGIYVYATASIPANAPFTNAALVLVFGANSATSQKIQLCFRYGAPGQGKFRVLLSGSWQLWAEFGGLIESDEHPKCYYRYTAGEQEWVNPPMDLGVEYRTTERWNGNPVYVKRIDLGTLTQGMVTVEHTLTINRSELVGWEAYAIHQTNYRYYSLPMISSSANISASIQVTSLAVNVYVFSDLSDYKGYIILRYTIT